MTAGSIATTATPGSDMRGRALAAASIGNFVEWYDFAVYSYSATAIAHAFFPASAGSTALLSTFAVFGVTFLLRPLGGVVLGRLGDRVGRRPVLALTVLLMGLATTLMGLIPSFATIGVAAPVLLIVLRLAQGFFGGGEFSGASTYLVEYAPPNHRGRWATLSMATGVFPFAVAGLVSLALASGMSGDGYLSYGWRIPFLVALPLAAAGVYLRLRIDETPLFRRMQRTGQVAAAPMRTVLRDYRKPVLLVFAVSSLNAVGSYTVTSYMPTFLSSYARMSPPTALLASSAAIVVLAGLLPLSGSLGDRIGRRPLILAGTIGIIALCIPGYLIAGRGTVPLAFLGQLLMIVPLVGIAGVLGPVMCELFPTQVRYSGSALAYNVAYALFGGTAPFIAAYLIGRTGTALAPAFYMIFFALLCLVAVVKLPETSRMPLSTTAPPTVPTQATSDTP